MSPENYTDQFWGVKKKKWTFQFALYYNRQSFDFKSIRQALNIPRTVLNVHLACRVCIAFLAEFYSIACRVVLVFPVEFYSISCRVFIVFLAEFL